MGLKNFSLVGKIYGLFPWASKIVLGIFRNLPEILKEADMNIYPEAYAATVGFLTVIGLIISIGGIPLTIISIYAPHLLGFLSQIPYYSYLALFLLPGLILLLGVALPKIKALNRASNLETEVPFLAAYVSVMATGGISPYASILRVKEYPLLPTLAKASKRIELKVRGLGLDPISAIEESAKAMPSQEYRELLLGYASTLRAGGDVVHYLLTKTEQIFRDRLMRLRILGERMAGMMEVYVTLAVLLALGFYSIFIVSISMAQYLPSPIGMEQFVVFAYVFLPTISIVFLYMIDLLQPKYPEVRMNPTYKLYFASIPFMVFLTVGFYLTFELPMLASITPFDYMKDFVLYVTYDLMGLEPGFETPVGLMLALVIPTVPAAVYEKIRAKHEAEIERGVIDFIRDLVEIRKTGMSPEGCIINLAKRDYGRFSEHLRIISNQVGWGIPLKKVSERFKQRVRSWLANTMIFLLVDAIEVGGGSPQTLETLARFGEMTESVEKEKAMRLRPLLLVPYIGALTFIVSTIVLLGFMRATLALANMPLAFQQFTKMLLTPMVFHIYLTGLVSGKISNGRVSAGFLHTVVLSICALIAMAISPLISLPLTLAPM